MKQVLNAQTSWNENESSSRRDSAHPVVKDYAKKRLAEILKYLPTEIINTKCLDAGAGDGFFSLELKAWFDLSIVDSSMKMLEKNPVKEKVFLMDCAHLGFLDNSFNLVFEANMLHHASNVDDLLRELVRVSSDYIVVLEPNRNHPLTLLLAFLKKNERKSLLFSKRYVHRKMNKFNVRLVKSFSFGFVPANKTPYWLWRMFRCLDRPIPFFGLENIYIYKKGLQ